MSKKQITASIAACIMIANAGVALAQGATPTATTSTSTSANDGDQGKWGLLGLVGLAGLLGLRRRDTRNNETIRRP